MFFKSARLQIMQFFMQFEVLGIWVFVQVKSKYSYPPCVNQVSLHCQIFGYYTYLLIM